MQSRPKRFDISSKNVKNGLNNPPCVDLNAYDILYLFLMGLIAPHPKGELMEILLVGAVLCMTALIVSAWLMTFARWFPIEGIDKKFLVDYKTMIRAHVDYALMALFNLGFYGVGIDLPIMACWCVAIGGFANPTVFVIAAFDPDFWNKMHWKVYTAASFIITTIGFLWVGTTLLTHAL